MLVVARAIRNGHEHTVYTPASQVVNNGMFSILAVVREVHNHMIFFFISDRFYTIDGGGEKTIGNFRKNDRNVGRDSSLQAAGIWVWRIVMFFRTLQHLLFCLCTDLVTIA